MDKHLLALKGVRPLMLLLGLLSLGQGLAVVVQALGLAKAITLLFHGASLREALNPLLLFALAFIARHTLVWLQRLCAGAFAESTSEDLRMRLLDRLFERGPGFTSRTGSGQLVTTALDGIGRFRTYIELFVPRTLDMMVVTGTLLTVIYMLDLTSGLILTFTMPILIAFFILLGLAARKLADKQWRSYQVLSRHFTDTLRGLETLRFLGRSRAYADTVEQVSDRYRSATMRTLRMAFLSSFALDFFSTLSVAFVAVGLGLRLIQGTVGLEAALAALLLAPEYFTPVRMLGSDYHASLDGKEAWKTIRHIIETDPDADTDADNSQISETPSPALTSASSQVPEPVYAHTPTQAPAQAPPSIVSETVPAAKIIEFTDVHVYSDDGHPQLAELTATLTEEMQHVGIVGMSGAGKTTLLQLLGGFLQPASGLIRLDGEPLTDATKRQWQQKLAFIPQHPYLFSRTLAHNVRFYDPDIPDDRVRQALEEVGLGELVRELPQGIMEPIGEGGRALSGGQAQRVALARALAGNRSVLLLDEPTAHLDIETELELKHAMLSIFQQRRVFLATHRLHWMMDMDWILVVDKGRLVEAGTHEQLIRSEGDYAKLWAAAKGEGR